MKKNSYILLCLFSLYSFSQDWQPSFQEALAISKVENKTLLLVFSGSDWCAPCIKLDKKIFKSKEFINYAKNNYVMYRADFPKKKSNKLSSEINLQNTLLADKFNQKGYFPFVVLLNDEQQVLGRIGYENSTPTEYISHLNRFIK